MFGMPDDIWVPIKLTIELATISTLALLVVATPLAWWLARSKAWFKEAAAAIVSLPMVLPPTVLGFYLLIALGPDGPGGLIASLWGARTLAFTFTGPRHRLDPFVDAVCRAADPQRLRRRRRPAARSRFDIARLAHVAPSGPSRCRSRAPACSPARCSASPIRSASSA